MITTFSAEDLKTAGPDALGDALERGHIVAFDSLPIDLPSQADMEFLREEMPRRIRLKNVSYHPEVDKITRLKGDKELISRATRILKEHNGRVQTFLKRAMPGLSRNWKVGTASFRPLEERGRNLSAHASNERVHVDAGAYGATHGDRVLRFFVNINPSAERVWVSKGPFAEVYRRYGRRAGIDTDKPRTLVKGFLNSVYSGALRAAERAGVSRAPLIDTSPFDRLMRRFHNWMKDTPDFQSAAEGHREFGFKPFSAWMVFTDTVSHACISGQYALIDTFVIPLSNCRHPEWAPINLLRRPSAEIPDALRETAGAAR